MRRQELLEFSQKVSRAENSGEFWRICDQALTDIGVIGLGYGVIPYASDAKFNGISRAGFFKHTYPSEWASTVGEDTLVDNDITVEVIIEGTTEAFWNDPSLLHDATDQQQAQHEIENDLGMEYGVSLALGQSASGQAISGIGLWIGDIKSDSDFNRYWRQYDASLRQISHIFDEGIRGGHAELMVALTPRERDCLTYLAVGLRPAEICWILKISEKTFEKFIKGAKDKLHANTRDHAVAKALVLNLIHP